jgi:phosphate transport system permease protein
MLDQHRESTRHLIRHDRRPLSLKHKFKVHEAIIQLCLFACGLLSILTTLGIILVLGNESIAFFTRDQWVNSNRPILSDMDEQTKVFTVAPGKTLEAVEESGIIRVGQEVMEVVEFQNNQLYLDVAGTGGGFKRWCALDVELAEQGVKRPQIVNASRRLNQGEIDRCRSLGIAPVVFPVGADALAITVSSENDFITELSFAELRQVFGGAEQWSDLRAEWPQEPIQLVIPSHDSGAFDFFVDAVLDADSTMMMSKRPIMSENDNQLAGSIHRNPFSIGFFGYAYFLANHDDLKLLALDGVEPSAPTVEDGSYALARPLYLYSDAQVMREQPQVADFISFYLARSNEAIVDVGYFQASSEALTLARDEWTRATGAAALRSIDPSKVSGALIATGSSTVFPLTARIGELFVEGGYLPRFQVKRGVRGENTIAPHSAGVAIEYNDQPTLIEFFTNTNWIPAIGEFGVIPLINATLMTSTIAMLVALPLGLGAAVYLSEYASPRARSSLKPVLEILAGIPTVVYGYFALTFMTPLLRGIFGIELVNIYNTGSAGIVVGILIIPLISSMSEDALHAAPTALREASYGLGATKLETVIKVVIPAALSGILAAFIVAVSRAIGETMIVAIAAGAGPNFSFNPFDSAETMTGHIARISGGDLSYDSIDYNSIFAIGLTLFLMTFLLNVLSRVIISRFREAY